ncbi:Xenobiotic-transporting ATPase [Syntrophobotulus glycolicus DSM 8271]|uniref:Xenobiotic-transporting ATPase n=1 Tax=Syntrophobotulus glycolicus (strain DSM 8271 / FlGlyR) TaxID=645991 RepID=F0SZ60_SYNGF|nr:ABC transporter ATP-binding protein [Syntrophobotulus glycolicus]ADY57178.1 Xenobiotic-transporting ATPase [Syntrophobotulus glycolicus DSM 8271]
MFNIQEKLMLTDKGYADLKKAIIACTITNLSLLLPFAVTIQIFAELMRPLTGEEISWTRMGIYFVTGIIAAILVFLANKNDYKKTYVASYMESEATRTRVAEHIRKLPMSFFNSKDLSELTTNIMGDCATTEHVLSHVVPQLSANAISITLICLMLGIFDWRLALTVFCTVPVAFLIIVLSRKIQKRLSEKHVEAKLKASDQVQEYLEGIKVIKSYGLDGSKFTALDNALKSMKQMAIKMEFGTGVFVTGAQIILQAGIGLTVFGGTYLLTGGEIELIPLLMFFLIVVRIYGPILTELTLLPELFYLQISTKRMRTLVSTPIMQGDAEKEIKDYNIVFEDVSFSYSGSSSPEEEVIKNVSITIPANGITALVGPSGSGKSTLSKLIARFWDVNKGTVKIGGIDIRTLDPEHLMSYMSFVFQDVVLFNDTVYNNIRIGDLNAGEEQVMAAAKAACCDEFISSMPDGYQTLLGENGSTLSGGERQRISIARALLKNAPIVLLDEATASLDPENEVLIQQAISKLIAGKTVIVIAHRLRTVAGADKIIVLDQGRTVEEGTHEELIGKKGLYEKLYTIQQESLGWSV